MNEVVMKQTQTYNPRPYCLLVALMVLAFIFAVLTWQILLH